jgi:citrate lyase subunit beta/citryl-CoA lyase
VTAATAVTWLFVPASRPDRFAKAAAAGAGVVIADLEDAVATADKDAARAAVAAELASGTPLAVRINGVGTPWHDADLALVAEHRCPVVLPKAESAADVAAVVAAAASHLVIPLVESATGILRAAELARVDGVCRLAFGNADLAAQLGVDPTDRTALLTARSTLVLASVSAGIAPPIDGVTLELREQAIAREDAEHGRSLGFGGKLCIHPSQVTAVEDAFAPTDEEIAWARRVVAAVGSGAGVGVVDGTMVDRPVILRAESVLSRAAGRPPTR